MVGYISRANTHSVFSCQSGGIGKFEYSRPGYSRNGRWAHNDATHARTAAAPRSRREAISVRIPPLARGHRVRETKRMRSLLFLLAALPLAAQQTPDAAVRSLVARYVDAREHRDAAALAALFTADADQLVSSGEWRKGRDAVVRGSLASSEATGGHRTITVESVRTLAPGVALADGRYEIAGTAAGQTRHMWTAILCVETPGGWRIAAIRNMLPAAPAR